ncbi:MAG: glycoside hydrolase family 2 protein [Eubacteriales bacterium]|nr:glycoside hydrolase family 2 protein [Eubacteriales bacterium]
MQMRKQRLKDNWRVSVLGENVYGVPEAPLAASIPASVYSTLLAHGLMPDPYDRDNELDALKLMENEFVFETQFTLSPDMLAAQQLFLRFEGIDTLADIFLNGSLIAHVADMHRTWEFDVTKTAAAENDLRILFHSPTKFIEEENKKVFAGGSTDAMEGFPHLRKAACMFGWDWGPRLPDAGLFREVSVLAVDRARIEQVYVTQEHQVTETGIHGNTVESVTLQIDTQIVRTPQESAEASLRAGVSEGYLPQELTGAQKEELSLLVTVTAPDGQTWETTAQVADGTDRAQAQITVEHPELWWPNGYGAQPLYTVTVCLQEGSVSETKDTMRTPQEAAEAMAGETGASDRQALDLWERRIGLRTVTVNQDPMPDEVWDEHLTDQTPDEREGKNFAFVVNGLPIFAMGADYIPEDNILPRVTPERTRRLLQDAADCHHNSIRIWGGGYFLDDFFYDICDELGLLVWQDMMFACADYELTPDFEENVRAEIRDNVRRLRHHACIGLWCGNNEMETQVMNRCFYPSAKQYYDYIRIYEYIIPQVMEQEDPQTFYWPSSPSSGGNYDIPEAENIGDTHYWGVWHGCEPFTAYRKHHYRFLSEFGFQSFPCLQTVESFTRPEDRNIFSRVMEMHQRNSAANGKILNYLSATYLYPKNFDELLYCSQLLQADAIRYGVEHFRRIRGTCMGVTVWQLNDIWPVASWASIDYYGRWKALQYAEKRMFAPVMISCEERGEIDQKPFPNSQPKDIEISATLHVANETGETVRGTVKWALRAPDSAVLREGSQDVEVPAYGGVWLDKLDFADADPLSAHFFYAFEVDGQIVSSGSSLFCAPKHYRFADPNLRAEVSGHQIVVTSDAYAKAVCVESADGNLRLDDNFFDMEKGSVILTIDGDLPEGDLRVRSVYGIA